MVSERGARRRKRRKGRLKGWLLATILFCVVVITLARWTESLVRHWFTPVVASMPGPLEEIFTTEALALWREELVNSPAAGHVRFLLPEGQRAQKGQAVAVLQGSRRDWREAVVRSEEADGPIATGPGDRNIYAHRAGLLRFDAIGPPRPDPMEALGWRDDVLREVGSVRQPPASGAVRPGDFLFRIVDNHSAYLLALWEGGPPIEEGHRVWVRERDATRETTSGNPRSRMAFSLTAGDEWEATVVATRPLPSGAPGDAVLLRMGAWPPAWETKAWFEADIVVHRYHGTVLPDHVLVQRGERWGVMIQGRSGPLFHPVNVLGRVQDQAAVTGVSPGVWIITGGT